MTTICSSEVFLVRVRYVGVLTRNLCSISCCQLSVHYLLPCLLSAFELSACTNVLSLPLYEISH